MFHYLAFTRGCLRCSALIIIVWPSSSFCASWQCCIMLSFFTPSRCTEVDLNRACEDNCKLASGEFEHMTNAWHKLHRFAKDHSSEANMSGDVRQFLSVWFALCRLACFCWVKLLFFFFVFWTGCSLLNILCLVYNNSNCKSLCRVHNPLSHLVHDMRECLDAEPILFN